MNDTVANGDPVDVLTQGDFGGFSGMTQGAPVYASETAGALADAAASGSTKVTLVAGFAKSATVVTLPGQMVGSVNS
jgi:hypothetical protein